jgi:hypothetical protein
MVRQKIAIQILKSMIAGGASIPWNVEGVDSHIDWMIDNAIKLTDRLIAKLEKD